MRHSCIVTAPPRKRHSIALAWILPCCATTSDPPLSPLCNRFMSEVDQIVHSQRCKASTATLVPVCDISVLQNVSYLTFRYPSQCASRTLWPRARLQSLTMKRQIQSPSQARQYPLVDRPHECSRRFLDLREQLPQRVSPWPHRLSNTMASIVSTVPTALIRINTAPYLPMY